MVPKIIDTRANLLNLTHDSIFVRDMENIITYWNRGAEEFYGWTAAEVVGKVTTHQLLQTVFPAPLDEIHAKLLRTGHWEGELVHIKADGTQAVVASRWSLQRDEQHRPQAILELNNDITERKRIETDVRQQASLLNLTHDSIFVRDMENIITYWNRGAEEFYGWTAAEVVGKVTTHQLLQTVFPAPLDEIDAKLLRTGRWEGELVHIKADGTQAIVASRWSLQRDEQQRPQAILELNNDITELKREQASLDKQRAAELEAANKELESFAYSVSHDLRAPLRHMVGYSELLQRQASSSLDEKSQRYIRTILDSAKRMGNLIDDLLAFSRIGRAEDQKDGGGPGADRHGGRRGNRTGDEGPGHRLEDRRASGLLRRPFHAEAGRCQPRFQRGQIHTHAKAGRNRDWLCRPQEERSRGVREGQRRRL